jgi:hypothetical protein
MMTPRPRPEPESGSLVAQETAARKAHNRALRALVGFVEQLPGGRKSAREGRELLAEIDAEMNRKLDHLARGK